MAAKKSVNIDEYISGFAGDTKKALEEIRAAVKKAAPDAEETISYAIPCFKLNGKYLICFAGYTNHIGIYPVPTEGVTFEKLLSTYKTSGKGTLQLPLNKPMPLHLITEIVKYRIAENLENTKGKKPLKKTTKS